MIVTCDKLPETSCIGFNKDHTIQVQGNVLDVINNVILCERAM